MSGMRVYLTRWRDKTLSLERRNRYAVSKKADLFISIHANAAKSRRMFGIETYYLNIASDRAAQKLAARENRAARRRLSSVEHILSSMLQNYDASESRSLAISVQKNLIKEISRKYSRIKNRRVRSALFYVLVGAKCPAILVETSFISNSREERRLRNALYQERIAKAIADGVRYYIKHRRSAGGTI